MKNSHFLFRRSLLATLAVSSCGAFALKDAGAQRAYPEKLIKVIVPYSPGSGADVLARILSERLGPRLGQPLIVENKAGASGMIGTAAVAAAPPDGYTLMIAPPTHVITSILRKTTYDPIKDFEPVALIAKGAFVLVAHPSTPATNLKEFIAYLKAQGDKATYSSPGIGSTTHLYTAQFQLDFGTQLRHVPGKGLPASVMDVMQNQVTMTLAPLEAVAALLSGGRLKAIAQTGTARAAQLPQVPTFAEAGFPGFSVELWFGVYAPVGTPKPVIARLNGEINALLGQPAMKELLAHQGLEPVLGGPELLATLSQSEFVKWAGVVKRAGIAAE